MEKNKSVRLTESAIMLAFATILSAIPIVQLPFGGSITACSMLPIILISYRHGAKWGLFTAFAYSLTQMLFGIKYFMGTSIMAAIAIILFDYSIAFTVLGLAGLFRKWIKNQTNALAFGAFFVCTLRYISHVISGCTVWAGVSIPSSDGILYSLIYNATYMVPETIVTIVGAVYVSRLLDFRSDPITRAVPQKKAPDLAVLFSGLWKAFLAIAVVYDVQSIFSKIQNIEDGTFDITRINEVNWVMFAAVTFGGIAVAVLFAVLAGNVPENSTVKLGDLFSALPVVGVGAAVLADAAYIAITLQSGSTTASDWVKFIVSTLAVIIAVIIVTKWSRSKRQAA